MGAPKGNRNAEGNEGGRPTKMPDDLIKRSRAYLQQCEDELEEVVTKERDKDSEVTTKSERKVNLPSIAGLASWLNVSRETVYAWQNANIEFSDICSFILTEQEKRLLDKGLSGMYNSNIAKLLLTKHGYADKTESDVNVKVEKLAEIQEATKTILNQ